MPRITDRERERAKRQGRPPRYLCIWTDEDGVRRQRLAFTDKRTALRFELEQQERCDKIREGLLDPDELSRREHQATDIVEHLGAFQKHLRVAGAGGRRAKPTEKYVESVRRRLDRFITWTGPGFSRPVGRLKDMTIDRAIAWIDDLETNGWVNAKGERKTYSGYSINEFIGALTMFSAWAKLTKRVKSDPLEGLGRRRRSRLHSQRTHVRRSVTPEQIADLVRAAEGRPLLSAQTFNRGPKKGQLGAKVSPKREAQLRAKGRERATLYLTLFWTGLRRSEARALCWGDLDLDGSPPLLRLRGETTKAKRGDTLALHPELCERLRKLKDSGQDPISETDPVFASMPERRTFLRDLEAAGIPSEEGDRYFDLHALRVSLATFLASQGVGQRLAQAHMRHTDPRLTAVTYTDAEALPVANVISSLPAVTANERGKRGRGNGEDETVEGAEPTECAAYRPLLDGTNGQNGSQPVTAADSDVVDGPGRKSLSKRDLSQPVRIGVRGFEPPTFSSRTRRATKLRYTPSSNHAPAGRRAR